MREIAVVDKKLGLFLSFGIFSIFAHLPKGARSRPNKGFLVQHNFSLQFLRTILEDFEESSEKKPTKVFLLNKFCNCGSCSNPILHYFPLSVCLCVCVHACHLNFSQLFDDLGPTPLTTLTTLTTWTTWTT